MRVVGGKLGGVILKAPAGCRVKPTADRVKEALFNILRPDLYQATVLDLYAGVGSLGIEALSRGAKSALFVERSPQIARYLKENLKKTKLEAQAEVWVTDVEKAIHKLKRAQKQFFLIFLDPPYKISQEKLRSNLSEAAFLMDRGGWVILEHSSKRQFEVEGLNLVDKRRYGDTTLSFFKSLR